MAHVVPWPASQQDAGYVNLHYSSVDRKDPSKLYKGGGWPFRSVETLIGRAQWVNTTHQFKDVWYCLSLQSQVKPNLKNPAKPKAQRLAANALAVKALWIDADVGTKAGEYPTIEDAVKAVLLFREAHKLPMFSAMVGSGGGLHAYWISKTPMTVKEWAPYAEGLRALLVADKLVKDPGITTDVARILRVPGTFNHKTTPPKPVQLFNMPLVMYDFPVDFSLFPTLAPAVSTVQVNKPEAHSLFAEGANMDSFKSKPILAADPNDTLQAGIDKHEDMLLDPRPIFTNCGFYKEALRTGGADYDNALWMYSVLGSTFMENGNAIAHQVSQGHASYSQVDTQALYDRKVAERADRGIGYPSCAAIAGAGCSACKTCPLFAKGKSPLNIRPAVTATVNHLNMALPQQSQGAQALNLPAGYDVDEDGCICECEEVVINGEVMPPKLHKLFYSILSDPWAQSNPDALNFMTTTDLGNIEAASIRHDEMGGLGLASVWGKQHIKIFPRNKARLEHFIVSWLAKLHALKAAQQSLPFGWYKVGDDIKGFVFGGQLMKDDGTETPCGVGDPMLRKIFHPIGDINHWIAAAKATTDRKRPELDAIIALSFASPLTALVGKNAMTLAAISESGTGKSSAYAVGVALWGHAVLGKAVSHSTFNSVMRKMGELSNLPLYWDEIKDTKAQAAVYDFIYTASDGTEKDRMKDGRDMQAKGSWQTLMMMAANRSFTDFVLTKDVGHVAGLSRVLEYIVEELPPDHPSNTMTKTDADMLYDKLKTSYGQMGLRYAKLLAMNHAAIQQRAREVCNQVEADFKATDPERLWTALVGVLIVGGELANTLGVEINVPAMKDFLYRTFEANRRKRDDMVTISGAKSTTYNYMNRFLAKAETNDQMLYTKGMAAGPGKPAAVSILHAPKDLRNTQVAMAVSVRWDLTDKMLFVSKDEFLAFLKENEIPVGTTMIGLRKEYGMETRLKCRIGAGVFTSTRLTCLVFDLTDPNHDWADQMYRWSPPEDIPEREPDPEPAPTSRREAPVDTGFDAAPYTGPTHDACTGLATPAFVQSFVAGAKRQGL